MGFETSHLATDREAEPLVTLYWRVLQETQEDLLIAAALLDDHSAPVGVTLVQQPATVWWPTSRWRAGDTVRMLVNTFPWWTGDRSIFGYGVAVVSGHDPWSVAARLPVVRSDGGVPPLDRKPYCRWSRSGESRASRMPTSRLRFVTRHVDWLVAALIAVIAALGYHSTIAPTVLDGDAALFQYTPSALGVIVPDRLPDLRPVRFVWKTLVPVGSIAYRMNFLSVVCGALALAIFYPALARLLEGRAAALCAVAIFGTLPTYWRWADSSRRFYTLHILL